MVGPNPFYPILPREEESACGDDDEQRGWLDSCGAFVRALPDPGAPVSACTKTGAEVYLASHGEWFHCDAYAEHLGGCLILRIVSRSGNNRGIRHYTVFRYAEWFDERQMEAGRVSTMVVSPGCYQYHGYDGVNEADL